MVFVLVRVSNLVSDICHGIRVQLRLELIIPLQAYHISKLSFCRLKFMSFRNIGLNSRFLGHCAEYCTYYVTCLKTGKVICVVVINKHQVGGSSPRMEPEACRLALQFLENQGIEIE